MEQGLNQEKLRLLLIEVLQDPSAILAKVERR